MIKTFLQQKTNMSHTQKIIFHQGKDKDGRSQGNHLKFYTYLKSPFAVVIDLQP